MIRSISFVLLLFFLSIKVSLASGPSNISFFGEDILGYGTVRSGIFSSDGSLIATQGLLTVVWDVKTGSPIQAMPISSPFETFSFTLDNQKLHIDHSLYDINTGAYFGYTEDITTPIPTNVSYSPDGVLKVTGESNGQVLLWDAHSDRLIREMGRHLAEVISVVFSPDGTQVLSTSLDSQVLLWNVETGDLVREFLGHHATIESLSISPDGKRVVTAEYQSGVTDLPVTTKIWDLDQKRIIKVFPFDTTVVDYSQDGSTILLDNKVINAITFEVIHEVDIHQIKDAAISPDGKTAIYTTDQNQTILMELSSSEILHDFSEIGVVVSVDYSPNGTVVAIASPEQVNIWNVRSAEFIYDISFNKSIRPSIKFSPSGHLLGVRDRNGLILIDVSTGSVVYSSAPNRLRSTSTDNFAISDDDRYLIATEDHGYPSTILREVNSGQVIKQFPIDWFIDNIIEFVPEKNQVVIAYDYTLRLLDLNLLPVIMNTYLDILSNRIGHGALLAADLGRNNQSYAISTNTNTFVNVTDGNMSRTQYKEDTGKIVEFSPRNRSLLIDDRYYGDAFRWSQNLIEESTSTVSIVNAHFSANEEYLVVGRSDNTAQLWKLDGLEQVITVAHHFPILDLAFNTQTQTLYTASAGPLVREWNTETNQATTIVLGASNTLFDLSDDGSQLAIADDQEITLYDVRTQEIVQVYHGHNSPITSIAISSDLSKIISGSENGEIVLWDVDESTPHVFQHVHTRPVTHVEFQTEFLQYALSMSQDPQVIIWNLQTGQPDQIFDEFLNPVQAIDLSPNNGFLLISEKDTNVRLFNLGEQRNTDLIIDYQFPNTQSTAASVVFSPDQRFILTGNPEGDMLLWDFRTYEELGLISSEEDRFHIFSFSPDGSFILSGSEQGKVQAWYVQTFEEVDIPLPEHQSRILSLALSSDGERLVTGSMDGEVILWNLQQGERVFSWNLNGPVNAVDITQDGLWMITGGLHDELNLWDMVTGENIHTFNSGTGIRKVAFSPDGQMILAGGDQAKIQLWNRTSQTLVHEFDGHLGTITDAAFSANGQRILTSSDDHTIQLWELPVNVEEWYLH